MDLEIAVTEWKRIYDHLYDMIYHAGRSSVLLPSSRMLEKEFGVSRPTIQKAFNVLKSGDLIIIRKGVGIFSNPQRLCTPAKDKISKVVGLLDGDGTAVTYGHSGAFKLFGVGVELTRRNMVIRPISLYGVVDKERVAAEIRSMNLDMLYMHCVRDKDRALAETLAAGGLPVLCFSEEPVHGCGVFKFDTDRNLLELAEILKNESRTEGILVVSETHKPHFGKLSHMLPKGAKVEWFDSLSDYSGELDRKLAAGFRPKFVVITDYEDSGVIDLLRKYGIDMEQECRLVSYSSWVTDSRFVGMHVPMPEDLPARVASAAEEILKGGKPCEFCTKIPTDFKMIHSNA